jgi:spore germination protein YaaH
MSPRFLTSLGVAALGLATFAIFAPAASAQTADFTRSVWIPYWKEVDGIKEIEPHLEDLDNVSPFVFEVDAKGAIVDRGGLRTEPWKSLLESAEAEGVKVYPTVSWFDGQAIHDTLKTKSKRTKHINKLMSAVISKNKTVDGIEIDYEGKLAETNPHFSKFLSELNAKLNRKKKDLICTIEARTPLADRYSVVTPELAASVAYANDYAAISKACDVVRIMAYDQGRAVVSLNRANAGSGYYAPIADVAWVRKVMASTTPQIAPSKLVMGIPTYGRVYRIESDGTYRQISSITYPKAVALAKQQGATVTRGVSGELGFTYTGLTSGLPGNATPTGTVNRYYVTFSDAVAADSATSLAKQLGLSGVALFKADGETDPATWEKIFK